MTIRGERIYLDREAGGVWFEPEDWVVSEGHFIRHRPTSTIFQIECDRAAIARNRATIFNFSARLVHVCDGKPLPDDEALVPLARAALADYLIETGLWKPTIEDVPERRPS